jgi:hypothetical protein
VPLLKVNRNHSFVRGHYIYILYAPPPRSPNTLMLIGKAGYEPGAPPPSGALHSGMRHALPFYTRGQRPAQHKPLHTRGAGRLPDRRRRHALGFAGGTSRDERELACGAGWQAKRGGAHVQKLYHGAIARGGGFRQTSMQGKHAAGRGLRKPGLSWNHG